MKLSSIFLYFVVIIPTFECGPLFSNGGSWSNGLNFVFDRWLNNEVFFLLRDSPSIRDVLVLGLRDGQVSWIVFLFLLNHWRPIDEIVPNFSFSHRSTFRYVLVYRYATGPIGNFVLKLRLDGGQARPSFSLSLLFPTTLSILRDVLMNGRISLSILKVDIVLGLNHS